MDDKYWILYYDPENIRKEQLENVFMTLSKSLNETLIVLPNATWLKSCDKGCYINELKTYRNLIDRILGE